MDIRRPYTRSTPCRRGEGTGSSVVSGTAADAPAAVSETRLLALVKAQDEEMVTALAEEAVPLQKKTSFAFQALQVLLLLSSSVGF